jgi:hypothetical protein
LLLANGNATNIDNPNGSDTICYGINSTGPIVGWAAVGTLVAAFSLPSGKDSKNKEPEAEASFRLTRKLLSSNLGTRQATAKKSIRPSRDGEGRANDPSLWGASARLIIPQCVHASLREHIGSSSSTQ